MTPNALKFSKFYANIAVVSVYLNVLCPRSLSFIVNSIKSFLVIVVLYLSAI